MDFKPSVFWEALTSPAFIDGVKVTIALTVVAMAFGLALGLVIAILRSSRWAVLRTIAWGYIWIFRAIPTLLQLLFVWDGLPQLFPALRGDWFSAFVAASIALSLNGSNTCLGRRRSRPAMSSGKSLRNPGCFETGACLSTRPYCPVLLSNKRWRR